MNDVWRTGPDLSAGDFESIRIRAIFDCCKWDPQFEDVGALAPFPLILSSPTWSELSRSAEELAREALAAEEEILQRPQLWKQLGISRAIRAALRTGKPNHGFARVMRFDFHLTPEGWRISEVNSDVPGGFVEGSGFASLVAAAYEKCSPAGNAAAAYVDAVTSRLHTRARVGLVHATAYTDDRQVMVYLGRALQQRGLSAELLSPADLRWNGAAQSAASGEKLDALIRFFPAEWLPNLPRKSRWPSFFSGSPALLSNPGASLFTQSKRFPLVWDQLSTSVSTWRALLPETRDPRDADWRNVDEWVLKPVLGRVGEGIGIRGVTPLKEWRAIARSARMWPKYWVAQRRFEAVPIVHNGEPLYPCVGVFVIDGRAAGTYGRIAAKPLVDSRARDVAILVNRS